jgi:hypothetical protein
MSWRFVTGPENTGLVNNGVVVPVDEVPVQQYQFPSDPKLKSIFGGQVTA